MGALTRPAKKLFLPGLAAAIVLIAAHGAAAQSGPSPAGEEVLFEQNCAVCHNNPATRAPARASLGVMSPSFIVEALTNGIMKAQGANLSSNRRIALAEFLTRKKIGAEAPMGGRCNGAQPPFAPDAPSTSFNGWGANVENWRFSCNPASPPPSFAGLSPNGRSAFPASRRCSASLLSWAAGFSSEPRTDTSIRSTWSRAAISGITRRAPG